MPKRKQKVEGEKAPQEAEFPPSPRIVKLIAGSARDVSGKLPSLKGFLIQKEDEALRVLLKEIAEKKTGKRTGVSVIARLRAEDAGSVGIAKNGGGSFESDSYELPLDRAREQMKLLNLSPASVEHFIRYLGKIAGRVEKRSNGRPRMYACALPLEGYEAPPDEAERRLEEVLRLSKEEDTELRQGVSEELARRREARKEPRFLAAVLEEEDASVWRIMALTEDELSGAGRHFGKPVFVALISAEGKGGTA